MKRSIAAAAVAGLLLSGLASAASAATVVGATTIEITNNNQWLQVGEVVALNGGLVDVAAAANGGSAVGSDGSGYALGHDAGKAIDGLLGTEYWNAPYIFHSAVESGGFLTISFGPQTLSSLSIYGRSDCCSERDVYNVVIKNGQGVTLYSDTISANNGDHVGTVNFTLPTTSPTPEPAAWALMISGFGLAGATLRRRRAAGVAA